MSFDLTFVTDPSRPALSAERFVGYFSARPRYTITDRTADYLDLDTGVYFTFELEDSPEAPQTVASFHLAYAHARFFAIEAASEIAAFVAAFGLSVDDPQADFAGPTSFSAEAFVRSWEAGNRRVCAMLTREGFGGTALFPASVLQAAHAWNFARAELQLRLGEDIFVPTVMFGELAGTRCTIVVWSDGVPTLIPDFVDQVLVHREELAPSRSLLFREERPGMLDRAQRLEFLRDYGAHDATLGAFRPSYGDVPRELAKAISELPPLEKKLVMFPADQVLDEDVILPRVQL